MFGNDVSVVLAHGAWADGSSWSKVILALQEKGVTAIAAPLPLTSLSDDVVALDRASERVDGRLVLVGHAYAGAVIGSSRNPRVKSLVYVTGLAPAEGQTSAANRNALRTFLAPETTRWQYTHGVPDSAVVSPDGMSLDNFYLARPGADEVQLDLFGDYKSNITLYPAFQDYFRMHKPRFLAVWGKHDPFFLPAGANAFKQDIPQADIRFFDTGHFALETHAEPIALAMREFLSR
jgi:pimeloyl-ACP methyl ester carboxylesterase